MINVLTFKERVSHDVLFVNAIRSKNTFNKLNFNIKVRAFLTWNIFFEEITTI